MAKKRKKKSKGRVLAALLIVLLAAGAYAGYYYYRQWLAPNTLKAGKLYIPTGADYGRVMDSLRPFLRDEESFSRLAKRKKYPQLIKPGRYTVNKGENNHELINRLRSGNQDEIAIRIGNYSSITEMAGRISPFLECDSQQIVEAAVKADFARGYDTAALIAFFFPDTYNFHWNTSAADFVRRMKRQYDLYWTPERLGQARDMGMTPLEVTTLASIVQLETAKPDEQPRVAGLYLNRLKIGMKLDADPTVIYAMRKAEGFTRKIQRVYYKNLLIASPYNTYRNKGLPPGPICMPNVSALEAVLRPARHNYLYFVADPQKPGYHIYAATLSEQEENARAYRQWLDSNKVQ